MRLVLSLLFLASLLARSAISQPQSNGAKKTSADYYVHSLPGQPEGPLAKMHAGHIEVDPQHHGNLFFWHIQNKHIADRERTVIWLNGGPGCSSMDGALMEVGPYRLKDDHTLVQNNGSWHEFASILFVDNPVGTGFSYVDTDSYVHELQEMADQFIRFLENFFRIFPEYEQDDLYISGESYAGQHIPYIAKAILDRNKQASTATRWNIKGLLIGNGWIDPVPQYESYLSFVYEHGLIAKNTPISDKLETQQTLCQRSIAKQGIHIDNRDCEQILQMFLTETAHKNKTGSEVCWNMYDIRLEDSFPSCGMNWPPDLTFLTPYLRREDVKLALHVNPEKKAGWTECSGAVSTSFRAAHSKPSAELLPELLAHMPIILFSGEKDLICNHIGTEQLIHKMEWNGGKGFELSPGVWAPRHDWIFENEPAGIYQSARNLTYVLFYNASHMVPFDFPRRTRDMFDRFIGVNIGTIGGDPTENRIGGEKAPITSVGGTPNSTLQEAQLKDKMDKARWEAYYHSGEVALVVVAIAASVWGVAICCARRRRKRRDYRTLNGGLKDRSARLEEGSFDPHDPEELTDATPMFTRGNVGEDEDRYSVGGASSDEEEPYTDKGTSIRMNDVGKGSGGGRKATKASSSQSRG